jgi:DNA-binding MarR family transcriptional regulator
MALTKGAATGGELLFRLVHTLTSLEALETKDVSVSRDQGLALMALSTSSGLAMSEIAEALGVSAGTATRVVDNLVRDDLVERIGDPDDRRKVYVRPTESGKERTDALRRGYERMWESVFGDLRGTRMRDVLEALQVLLGAVQREKERAS